MLAKSTLYIKASVAVLLVLILAVSLACSKLPWPKRSRYTKEELARLADKDVYTIDEEHYIKVPTGTDEKGNVTFAYVRVEEYLSGKVEPLPVEAERIRRADKQEPARPRQEETAVVEGNSAVVSSTRSAKHPYLKRKMAIVPFEDRTDFDYGKFGTQIANRLADRMEMQVFTSLVMDWEMITRAMDGLDLTPQDLEDPANGRRVNAALGVQGIITGAVYGPFVTSSAQDESEKRSMALIQISLKFIDAAQARVIKEFVAINPLADSEQMGDLSEERAKYKAIDLAIDQIIAQIAPDIGAMDWFTRITYVDGTAVYLNAGYQTGLKEGDLLQVYPSETIEGGIPKGSIRVTKLFGFDASMAQVIKGSGFQVNDVVRFMPYSS